MRHRRSTGREVADRLRESEERYRLLVEHAGVGIEYWSPDGLLVLMNKVALRHMQGSLEGLAGKSATEIYRPGFGSVVKERIERVVLSREALEFDDSVVLPSGAKWFLSTYTAVTNARGEVLGVQIVSRDVTERRLTELAVEESDRKHRTLVETLQEGVWAVDLEGITTFVNPAMARMLGYTVQEMRGKHLFSFLEAQRERLAEKLLDLWITGAGEIEELELVRRDGTRISALVRTAPIRGAHGVTVGGVASVLDITERRRADLALRQSETRFRALFEQAGVGVAILESRTGRFVQVNQKLCDIMGYSTEEMRETTFMAITHPDDLPAGLVNMELLREGRIRQFSMEKRYLHRSGRIVWGSLTVSPLWQGGEPTELHMAVVEDITERKEAEEALRRSQTELRTIYENAPTMMCVLDASRQVLYANRAFAEFVGRPVEELRLERACGVVGCLRALDDPRGCGYGPRCETCSVRLAMVDTLATGRSRRGIEYRTTAMRGGQPRDSVFLASVAAIQISGRSNLLLCLEDITERERVAEALRDAEEQFRSLEATSLDAVLLTTPEGRILAANAAACTMFGRSEQNLMRVGLDGVVDAADPRLQAALEIRDRTGGFHGEIALMRRDGTKFPGEISSAVFRIRGEQVRTATVIRDISDRMIAAHELQRSHQQLRALAARIQDVREQERSGVARELHDELGQALTAMKMDLRWLGRRLDPGHTEVRAKVNGMIELVDQTIQAVQRLASRLRPRLLDDLGLAAAIEWLGADCGRHSGIRCDVSADVTESRIGPKSTTALFRIIQEALTNVVRHASASRVTVRLREMGSDLEAMVADDGAGISGADAADARSFGLLGMSERARGIGGWLSIQGEPGKGTIVLVTVPLPPEGALP